MKLGERVSDRSIRVVYGTILALGTAYGLAISLVAMFLVARGFDASSLWELSIFFALGIVLFSIPSGAAIRRFGAKPVLVVSLVGYAAAVGLFPLAHSFTGFAALRFFDGAFSVGVWVASETVILTRAPRGDKAYFTSLYAIALALGYVIGPGISAGVVKLFSKDAAFVAAGLLAAGTALGVQLLLGTNDGKSDPKRGASEDAHGPSELRAGQIFWRIKMSCLATFSYGYFQASIVIFLPLYLLSRGLTELENIVTPAFFAAGMLLFANLAAKAGDRHGHLLLMRVLGTIGTGTIISFLFVQAAPLVYLTAFVAGASLASVSPVSLALQGIVIPEADLPRAGGMYNAAYAFGMLVGPPVSGLLFHHYSGRTMITHFVVLWSVFVLLTVIFRRDDPRVLRVS